METTKGQVTSGVALQTGRHTTLTVNAPALQLLIGGPYTDVRKEEHTYGHAALRVITDQGENIYDFGRYAGERTPTGQGRLRIWNSFQRYIESENSYGRVTTGFRYTVSHADAERVQQHYARLIAGQKPIREYGKYMAEYRLATDYHALNTNCVTVSMSGARLALGNLETSTAQHNQGRGMSFTERTAAKLAGWPSHIFMPADLQSMLAGNQQRLADKIETYGASAKK